MGATTGPYDWDPHGVAWAILIVLIALVVIGHRRLLTTDDPPIPWTRRQVCLFAGACAASAVALTWPLADLATHWSLTALVTQRLILVMAVAPMLLLGLPYDVIRWLTRPAAVDTVLVRLRKPPVAIAVVTVLLVGSMAPVLVRAQATSPAVRGVLDGAMVAAGLVLWIPVLGRVPGILPLKPVVRFGYLVFQAVVPAFLSFIYIFSRHPLYLVFAHSQAAIGLRPLNDQQLAGFVSKLTMLFTLLTVGAVVLARAPRSDAELGEDDPLVWADVEREFERVDRQGLKSPEDRPDGPGDRDAHGGTTPAEESGGSEGSGDGLELPDRDPPEG